MNKNPDYLVTGGAGYIGSHTVLQLLERGANVTVFDNLANSSRVALERVAGIAGKAPDFILGDLRSADEVNAALVARRYDAVIHFGGLKAVGESVANPVSYFQNNVAGTLNLLDAMAAAGVRKLVFSSSATVYGVPETVPIAEDAPRSAVNPYGRSKLMIEDILHDLRASDPRWSIISLRYFNPVGAHPSGRIGEDPGGIPNNLMPFITQVACGRREKLSVFGGDYPTADGTGVRDYIHVQDLARGHLAALDYLDGATAGAGDTNGATAGAGSTDGARAGTVDAVAAVNLGTGRGISVLELVRAFERTNGVRVPYDIAARRPGDVAACFADPSLARRLLGWEAELGVDEMCRDAWNWQSRNPMGYGAHD